MLDLAGTFAFAIYGSYFALKKEFDLFGIFVSAFLTAVGGGTIRELLLNSTPQYFVDMNYLLVITGAVLFTIVIYKKFDRIKKFALVLDSIGLVTFAFIGAARASEAGMGIFGITLFAVLTAVGGGLLRDVILQKVSTILYEDLYASVAIVVGLLYAVFESFMQEPLWAGCIIGVGITVRFIVISKQLHLWRPRVS